MICICSCIRFYILPILLLGRIAFKWLIHAVNMFWCVPSDDNSCLYTSITTNSFLLQWYCRISYHVTALLKNLLIHLLGWSHVLELCREESGIFSHANENLRTSDGDSTLERGLNQWKVQVAAALKGGAGEIQSMILKVLLVVLIVLIIFSLYVFI